MSGVVMHLAASLDGDVAPDKLLTWLGTVRKALGERSLDASRNR